MKIYLLRVSTSLLLLASFFSCRSKVEEALNGQWSIDTIIYRQYEIRNCLSVNIISFNRDICDLPITRNRCEGLNEFVRKGMAEVDYNGDSTTPLVLKIFSDNEMFGGTHRMIFRKDDENRLLKMELISDSLYLVCRKGLFDYDNNIDLVNDLIKISH